MAIVQVIIAGVIVIAAMRFLTSHGLGWTEFRIENATGQQISVKSRPRIRTVHIRDKKAALLKHSSGDIIIKLPDGRTWTYWDLTPDDLMEAHYLYARRSLLFGFWHNRANLTVTKDGLIYAVRPNQKNFNLETLEQPKGFPRIAEQLKRAKLASEQPLPTIDSRTTTMTLDGVGIQSK